MLNEEDKRLTLVNYFNFATKSLDSLCHGTPNLFHNWVDRCVDFVRFLPCEAVTSKVDFQRKYNEYPISTWKDKDGLNDMDAIAYILSYTNLEKWIKADVARVYTIRVYPNMGALFYRNVFTQRRKRWGMFK